MKIKLTALVSAFAVIALGVLLVRHYFYVLDAYYYTAEFHVFFMMNNIGAANADLLKEYFNAFHSPVAAFPALLLAYVVQSFLLPFSQPVLASTAEAVWGAAAGMGISLLALLTVGILSCGLARFFLGDIVPLIRKLRGRDHYEPPRYVGLLLGIALAVPWAPLVPVTALMALLGLPLRQISGLLLAGLGIRVILSIVLTGHLA